MKHFSSSDFSISFANGENDKLENFRRRKSASEYKILYPNVVLKTGQLFYIDNRMCVHLHNTTMGICNEVFISIAAFFINSELFAIHVSMKQWKRTSNEQVSIAGR